MTVQTSIVIRTLNESKHLENLMRGIHDQNYRDWEIVLVDSGSTDGTLKIAEKYGARIFHIPQDQFTFGRSLNWGCREAVGEYLVFASGHVWPITNNWLRNIVKPFEDPAVAMVYGRQRGTDANRLSEIRDLDANFGPASNILVDEAKANNGNSAIRQSLWQGQPFDESLPGLEDVDWARKVERQSYRVYYAADASVYHVHEESLHQVYRRYQREAEAAKQMFPGFKFSWSDMILGLPYFMLRDLLYAFRQGKQSKIFQVPTTRTAQFLGFYNGVRYQKKLNQDITSKLNLPESSRRVVIDGPNEHGLRTEPLQRAEKDDVIVKVAYAGVSGADLRISNGRSSSGEETAQKYPFVPGVEFSGVVADVGSAAGSLKKGQKITGFRTVWCGRCGSCLKGEFQRCEHTEAAMLESGSYAEYVRLDPEQLGKLPTDVPLLHGALTGSLAACLEALGKLPLDSNKNICVLGAGPLGNICAQVMRSHGARVTSVDPDNRWLPFLFKYEVNTHTKLDNVGQFDHFVVERTDPKTLARIVDESRPDARVLILDFPRLGVVPVDGWEIAENPKIIFGTGTFNRKRWQEAIRLVHAKAIDLVDHSSTVIPLEQYREASARAESGEAFKVLLSVNSDLGIL
jgi:threonine dehydrogenase-like Zn-dependent dehydrogenase/GT2 family glycosyltransferase